MSFNPAMVPAFFSKTASEARDKFHTVCETLDISVTSYRHPLPGPDGGPLTVDVARLGAPNADNLVIVISGTHGLEGLAGSGCQTAWLHDNHMHHLPPNTAVLFIHLLNPWGAAWGRRQTEDNVDLNRNFVNFSAPRPDNHHYDALRDALNCSHHNRDVYEKATALIRYNARLHGDNAVVAAIFQGQYRDSQGVGFGGTAPTWSNRTFHAILKAHAGHPRHVAVIDIHTGLGPYGYGMLINTSHVSTSALDLAQQWYGPSLTAVRADPSGIPYNLAGDLCSATERLFPSGVVVPVALEFGTFTPPDLLRLQIVDTWLHSTGNRQSGIAQDIRAKLWNFFYPATDDWCEMLYFRARQVIRQAIRGLEAQS